MRRREPAHDRLEGFVIVDDLGWNYAFLDDPSLIVDVSNEIVQRLRALLHAPVNNLPFRLRENARDDIERYQTFRIAAFAIYCECNTDTPEEGFCFSTGTVKLFVASGFYPGVNPLIAGP